MMTPEDMGDGFSRVGMHPPIDIEDWLMDTYRLHNTLRSLI